MIILAIISNLFFSIVLTSLCSYGKVCYHNFMGVADYGKLGHGEVVGMRIPASSIGDFAKEYFDLFTPKGGEFLKSCKSFVHEMTTEKY